ncbi:MAG: DUF2244 domain-containing protein [Rhodospirillales bacterium]
MQSPSRAADDPTPLYQAVLEPHRSASARNINTAIIVFALAALPLSLIFSVIGAWPVSIFIGLDVVLLFAALRLHFWFGRSREVITITHDLLTVERIGAGGRRRTWAASPHWMKVVVTELDDDRNRLELRTRDNRTEIGRFLNADEKVALARELRGKLAAFSVWRGSVA